MALNNGNARDAYSGRPAFYLRLYVWRSSVSGNSAKYSWWLRAYNPERRTQTYTLGSRPWAVNVEGNTWSGNSALDFRGGQEYIQLGTGTTGWKAHSSTGYLTVNYSASHTTPSVFGSASLSGSFASDRIPKAPGKPPRPVFKSAAPTSISFTIAAPSDNGGAAITTYDLQASKSSTFSSVERSWSSGSSAQTATPLDPGNSYWIRYRARSSVGAGAWSDALKADTLPATAPGISVTPTLTGAGATVSLTPPQNASGVTKYRVERRLSGTTAPVTSTDTATSPLLVSGLTPGAAYDYRASAFYGTYQTPWSTWLTRVQPKPSTNAGDYFDGSSSATDDQTFSWTGTAQKSMSLATGVEAKGWGLPADTDHSSFLTVQRVHGGAFGTYAALATFLVDLNETLFLGVKFYDPAYRSEVEPRATYYGSMYVQPSRSQRMLAAIVWTDSSGDLVQVDYGLDQVVVANEWTRLSISAQAPDDAAFAGVLVSDVTGEGHSLWQGGDTLRMDAAMITLGDIYPYFDGSFPDDDSFAYSWTETPWASPSLRESLPGVDPNLLVDPDCPPLPVPPTPPSIDSSCIEEVGIWRRYWVSIPATEVSAWKTMVTTMELRTQDFAARQVRIRVRPNPFNYGPDQLDENDWCAEQIISYMPADTILTLDGLMERTWAEVQGSAPVAADHLLYGTGGVPATWPELTCGIGYLISLDVPLDAPESNLDIGVLLTPRE